MKHQKKIKITYLTESTMPKLVLIMTLIISLFFLSACQNQQTETSSSIDSYTDSLGNKVEISQTPGRVISLSPAITEILFALELENTIVGTTDFCDYPEAANLTPKVGGFNTPNMELIVDSEPDIIFISSGVQAELSETFKKLNLQTFALDASTVEGVIFNIRLLGDIMNATDQAENIASDMEQRMAYITNKVKGLEAPLVFFEVWDDPLLSAGPNTFIHNIIELSGAKNFAADFSSDYPQISIESLIDRDPDIYIAVDHKSSMVIADRPGYSALQAIQNQRYYRVHDDYVTLPGPRIIKGLEVVAEIVHPDIFR